MGSAVSSRCGSLRVMIPVPASPFIQVYVLEVTWSEGTKTVIYRRYSRFFEFQVSKH